MKTAFVLYNKTEMLDFAGPFNILGYCGAAQIIAAQKGPVDMMPSGSVVAEQDFTCPDTFDVVVVPGGIGQVEAMQDDTLLAFLRRQHKAGAIIASVCTGALILASAGLLEGKRATTHWKALGELGRMGANAIGGRVVDEGQIITAAGVSAGIDMALHLVARELGEDAAKMMTLSVEYDPAPPFDTGNPQKAGPDMVAAARKGYRYEP